MEPICLGLAKLVLRIILNFTCKLNSDSRDLETSPQEVSSYNERSVISRSVHSTFLKVYYSLFN